MEAMKSALEMIAKRGKKIHRKNIIIGILSFFLILSISIIIYLWNCAGVLYEMIY